MLAFSLLLKSHGIIHISLLVESFSQHPCDEFRGAKFSQSDSGSCLGDSSVNTAATNERLYDYYECFAALEGRGVPNDSSSVTARCVVIEVKKMVERILHL